MSNPPAPQTIDEYIATFPSRVQSILKKIRATVKKSAPGAEEKISYRMPAFTFGGRILIYFAAFKNHIGLYPPVKGDRKLEREVKPFAGEKGNLRFPFDRPIPYDLIQRIVTFRVNDWQKKKSAPKKK